MTIWAAVAGYEGAYEVSNEGDVRSLARRAEHKGRWGMALMSIPAKVLKQNKTGNGYFDIQLSKDGEVTHHLVHRLVARAFIGPSELQVNHKDGVKANNRVDNLEYCTASENMMHATRVLEKRLGEANGMAKLTAEEVSAIRLDGRILRLIAADYGVTLQAIHHVKSGRNWGHSA